MKKILSLLMAVSVLTAAVPAMATTEGIVQGDIMMTSAEGIEQGDITATSEEATELNTYKGEVKEIAEDSVIVTIDGTDYTFMLAEGVELGEIAVGDTVEVTSPSLLKTKDIKEATSITKAEAEAEDESAVSEPLANTYNSYVAVVGEVTEDAISVVIEEDMVVSFRTSEDTILISMDGAEATEVKKGDKVIVISSSLLKTKDIKFADAIIINNEGIEQSVKMDTFDIVDEQLISADGNLVLNVENAEELAGKKLIVFYSMMTMSLPAQTAPEKVVIIETGVSISFNVGDKVLEINGEDVEVEIAPYIVGEGVTLVPLRVISESFGAQVAWDGETQTVHIIDGENAISLQIANKTAFVNGEPKEMEEAPELLGTGVTMVPLRFISEALGADVNWGGETQLITVSR